MEFDEISLGSEIQQLIDEKYDAGNSDFKPIDPEMVNTAIESASRFIYNNRSLRLPIKADVS